VRLFCASSCDLPFFDSLSSFPPEEKHVYGRTSDLKRHITAFVDVVIYFDPYYRHTMITAEPHFFMTGMKSPFTRPSSPSFTNGTPTSPLSPNNFTPEELLISLQILAFAEHGVGSELEAL